MDKSCKIMARSYAKFLFIVFLLNLIEFGVECSHMTMQ